MLLTPNLSFIHSPSWMHFISSACLYSMCMFYDIAWSSIHNVVLCALKWSLWHISGMHVYKYFLYDRNSFQTIFLSSFVVSLGKVKSQIDWKIWSFLSIKRAKSSKSTEHLTAPRDSWNRAPAVQLSCVWAFITVSPSPSTSTPSLPISPSLSVADSMCWIH